MTVWDILKKVFIFLFASSVVLSFFYVFSYVLEDKKEENFINITNYLERKLSNIKVVITEKIKYEGKTKKIEVNVPNIVYIKTKNGIKKLNITFENGFFYKPLKYWLKEKETNIMPLYEFPSSFLEEYSKKLKDNTFLNIFEKFYGKEQIAALMPFVNPSIYVKYLADGQIFLAKDGSAFISFVDGDHYVGGYLECVVGKWLNKLVIGCKQGNNPILINRLFKKGNKVINKTIRFNGKLYKPYNIIFYKIIFKQGA